MKEFTLEKLAAEIGGELCGDGSTKIACALGLDSATAGSITYATDKKTLEKLAACPASAAIVPENAENLPCPAIKAKNPAVAFALASQLLAPEIPGPAAGRHPHAQISAFAKVDSSACIGAGAVIEDNAEIAAGVKIYPNSYIGHGVKIGRDSMIYSGVNIYYGCQLGERCIIHSGSVIGADGFGFQWDGTRHLKIPQTGNVVIGDEVELGANATIDRGRFGSTVIGSGCKIDNLVHIAHNCRIGECSVFAGLVGVSGSVEIGRGVVAGGQVGFADHIKIADGAHFYAKSGVASDIEKGGIYAGQPAKDIKSAIKEYHNMRSVGELKERIKQLEKKLEKLENETDNSGK